MVTRLTTLLSCAALGLAVLAAPVPALTFETAASIKSKINIAGRQRMLTQRMTKAACMLSLDVAADQHRKQLLDAQALFDRSLTALKRGDAEMNLQPESSKRVMYALEKVGAKWLPLHVELQPVINGAPMPDATLQMLADKNLALLKDSHKAVGLMERAYVKETGSHGANRALNFAGAQRMLSQRIAKDLCFIAAGINVEATRVDLFASAATFEKRQQQLVEGDATGKVAKPSAEVHAALLASSQAWAVLKPEIDKLKAGGVPATKDLEVIAAASDDLLKRANAAVQVMEGAARGS
ncbi:MAG: type IV pili methyl-accepting chemotaxis transducer N-terminal domain-containing protein [Pseudomonadota bacterium]